MKHMTQATWGETGLFDLGFTSLFILEEVKTGTKTRQGTGNRSSIRGRSAGY